MPTEPATQSVTVWDHAVERFFLEYPDRQHAIMDWRLGYSVVERLALPVRGRTVLDYGCGNGRFCRLLRDRGARVIGLDISPEVIEQARAKNGQQVEYHVIASGDMSMVPPESMDLAVSTFVLCCVKERAELDRIVQGIHDRLKPGCCYVLSEPNPDAVGRQFYSMHRQPRGPVVEGTPLAVHVLDAGQESELLHDFWHAKQLYLDVLRGAGFTVEHTLEPTMNTYPAEPQWKDERTHPPFIVFRARK